MAVSNYTGWMCDVLLPSACSLHFTDFFTGQADKGSYILDPPSEVVRVEMLGSTHWCEVVVSKKVQIHPVP